MKQADYVYIERIVGNCNNIVVTEYIDKDIRAVNIIQTKKEKHRQVEKDNKRLVKVLKKYCNEKTVIAGNKMVTQELEIPNQLFEMRKWELQNHVKEIMSCFKDETGMVQKRRVFLMVLESKEWNLKEVTNLLWVAKDYYEDIYLLIENPTWNVERLVDFFYTECGVVVHLTTERFAKRMQTDFSLFLLKHWRPQIKDYYFRKGYVVSEWEEDLKRKRKNKKITDEGNVYLVNRELYSGFVYEYEKKPLSYEDGVLFSNNQFLLDKIRQSRTENPISVVAIYGVE